MLIVSQDKTMIINLNNVESIDVCDGGMKGSSMIRVHFRECSFVNIARYKTKERAMEVMDNLTIAYGLEGKVFKMPKE